MTPPSTTYRVSCVVTVDEQAAHDEREARSYVGRMLSGEVGVRTVEVDGVTELNGLRNAVDAYLSAPNLRGENYRALMALVALSKGWNGGVDVFQAARIKATR